jgi:hypothetical protein
MISQRIKVNVAGGLDVPLARMARVRQKFATPKLPSVVEAVAEQMRRPEARAKVRPGMTLAVGCGSRGIKHLAECVRAVVGELKALGARPFVFPAMGSHGGATAAGQRQVLESCGVTEDSAGCPIRAAMETVELGRLEDGMPVYMDRCAAEADGVVFVARVKPHTNFRASCESGMVKMMTIGMGKMTGAAELHTHGMDTFGELLPQTAKFIMAKKNILFGVAMVENAAEQTAMLEVVPAEQILRREPELLRRAKELMARLYFDDIDVLVVERIGKNISGAGMDPNVTGRNMRFIQWEAKPRVQKIVALGLTAETHGNATGVGAADVITMRLYRQMDIAQTYANVITSAYLDGAAIPIIMNTDKDAISLAVKTVIRVKPSDLRLVRIHNTLELGVIEVSEAMLAAVSGEPSRFDILSAPAPLNFDSQGRLPTLALDAHEQAA